MKFTHDVIVIGGGLSRIPELIAGLPAAISPITVSRAGTVPTSAARTA